MENRNKRQMNIIKSWFLERINNIDKTVIETDLEKKKKNLSEMWGMTSL